MAARLHLATGSIWRALVLCSCFNAASASRVKVKEGQAVSNNSTGSFEELAHTSASNPLLNGFAVATDVVLDSLSKVPVTSLVNMNKKWDARQQAAVDEWYERDDPHRWASNSLGFRALEMAFFAMGNSPLLFDDDVCEWTDMYGRRTSATLAQPQMKVKWQLYESAKTARSYRVQFEESFTARSPPQMGMGGFSGDPRLEGAQNFVSNKAQQVMRCAIKTMEKDSQLRSRPGYKLFKVAKVVSEVLDMYGKMPDGKLSEMSLKLAAIELPEASPCEGPWSKGKWGKFCKDECTLLQGKWGKSTVDSQGRHVVGIYDMNPFYKPWLWTQWVMKGSKEGTAVRGGAWGSVGPLSVEWRMTCVDDVATQISDDDGENWYTWSGFDGTYYADFDTQKGSTGQHGSPRVTMYSYIQKI